MTTTSYNIYEMSNLLRIIGGFLGEDTEDGDRFSRDLKMLWLSIASDKITNLLPQDLLKETYYYEAINTVLDQDIYELDSIRTEGILDLITRVDYDVDGNDNLRECRRVSDTEMQRIIQMLADEDLDEDNYVSNDNPVYCIHRGTQVASYTIANPEVRKFSIQLRPIPSASNTNAIRITGLHLPQTMQYESTGGWVSATTMGLTLNQKTIIALIEYTVHLGKLFDKEFNEASLWSQKFYQTIRELNRNYSGKVTDNLAFQVKIPNLL